MEAKTKRNIVLLSLFAGVVGIVLWKRKVNSDEAKSLLDYVRLMPSQVDLSTATQQGIDLVRGTNINPKMLKIGNLSGSYIKGGVIANEIYNTLTDLRTAMDGLGTDHVLFYKSLAKIKNKNTLAVVDKLYKLQYGEGLFEAMAGESKLNNPVFSVFSDKTKHDIIIPFYSEAKWSPILSTYFNNLPTY